ncbi:hypothetical protein JCM10213_003470 [Rhodosporidiobolus nylandii]
MYPGRFTFSHRFYASSSSRPRALQYAPAPPEGITRSDLFKYLGVLSAGYLVLKGGMGALDAWEGMRQRREEHEMLLKRVAQLEKRLR